MSQYSIELDIEQLELIKKSLDFFARMNLGQLSELSNPYMITLPDAEYSDISEQLQNLKNTMFPNLPEKSYYSIKSKMISDDIRQVVDIFETINYAVSPEKNKPWHWSTEKNLPIIKKLS